MKSQYYDYVILFSTDIKLNKATKIQKNSKNECWIIYVNLLFVFIKLDEPGTVNLHLLNDFEAKNELFARLFLMALNIVHLEIRRNWGIWTKYFHAVMLLIHNILLKTIIVCFKINASDHSLNYYKTYEKHVGIHFTWKNDNKCWNCFLLVLLWALQYTIMFGNTHSNNLMKFLFAPTFPVPELRNVQNFILKVS